PHQLSSPGILKASSPGPDPALPQVSSRLPSRSKIQTVPPKSCTQTDPSGANAIASMPRWAVHRWVTWTPAPADVGDASTARVGVGATWLTGVAALLTKANKVFWEVT